MYHSYQQKTPDVQLTLYHVGEQVVYIGPHEYANGTGIDSTSPPKPWRRMIKYKIVKVYPKSQFFAYEVLSELNHDWATDILSGLRVRNEEDYARYVQDWHNNHLCKILAEE